MMLCNHRESLFRSLDGIGLDSVIVLVTGLTIDNLSE